MRAVDKLRVRWGRRAKDLMFYWPTAAGAKSDAHYLHARVFTEEFMQEMKKRGYDLTTLRFEIAPQIGNDKFASQQKGDACG